ncbi:MAG: WbqC family protein [Alistipes sp.]|nr:WbqC family protein [Alistipes sp.]
MKTVLPLTYWGNVEYFANLLRGGEEAIIDLGENYVKRSERNRTEIVTPTGGMVLSVPLIKANRPRTPMRDMRIDNSKRWQHQHWVAILSAYRSSPYFDYIADRIAPIYEREWKFLTDLNREILQAEFDILGISPKFQFSEIYVEPNEEIIDLRDKKRESRFCSPQYFQMFMDRTPFVENASMLDLLMCEGREAISLLDSCQL